MSQTKQICNYALHTFLEQVEQAILEGFRVHKTPTSYAKLIGGRYSTVMVKPKDAGNPDGVTLGIVVKGVEDVVGGEFDSNLETPEPTAFSHEHTMKLPPVKPAARKTTKKAGDSDE